MSAALGLYVQVVKELGLVKVPVPLLVQSTLEALLAPDPKVMFTGPFEEQVVTVGPATAVGFW